MQSDTTVVSIAAFFLIAAAIIIAAHGQKNKVIPSTVILRQ